MSDQADITTATALFEEADPGRPGYEYFLSMRAAAAAAAACIAAAAGTDQIEWQEVEGAKASAHLSQAGAYARLAIAASG